MLEEVTASARLAKGGHDVSFRLIRRLREHGLADYNHEGPAISGRAQLLANVQLKDGKVELFCTELKVSFKYEKGSDRAIVPMGPP